MRRAALAAVTLAATLSGAARADDAGALQGLKPAEIRAKIGAPNVAHAEGKGALWTYRLTRCALMVFFADADGRGLRVTGVEAGPRRRGETPPTPAACMAEALEAAK